MRRTAVFLLLCFIATARIFPYKILYAEQFYKLYHLHFYQNPDNTMENIVWLEKALEADFCNPLYALAAVEGKEEWRTTRKNGSSTVIFLKCM